MKFYTFLLKICQKASSNRILWLLGFVFLGLNILVFPGIQANIQALSQGAGALDIQPFYTAEEAFQHINIYGPEGRKLYLLVEWTADLVYPITYGVLFAGILFRLGAANWSIIPLISAGLDYLENIGITIMLVSYPNFCYIVATITSWLTATKWMFAFASMLTILVRCFLMMRKKWVRQEI